MKLAAYSCTWRNRQFKLGCSHTTDTVDSECVCLTAVSVPVLLSVCQHIACCQCATTPEPHKTKSTLQSEQGPDLKLKEI